MEKVQCPYIPVSCIKMHGQTPQRSLTYPVALRCGGCVLDGSRTRKSYSVMWLNAGVLGNYRDNLNELKQDIVTTKNHERDSH